MTRSTARFRTRGVPGGQPSDAPPANAQSAHSADVTDALPARVDQRLTGAPDEPLDERFYRRMRFIRRFEERLLGLFEEGLLNGTTHACIGQEANCVGVIDSLSPSDHIFSNHRCHGHYLAWTGDAIGLLAEIMGKRGGVVGGVGGSQHIAAPGFKSNGILGGTVPAAAGIALAMKLSGSDGLSVVFMGDGAFGEGVVYETLNIASQWQLPLLFVVENNGYSQSTPISVNLAGDIPARFAAFAIPVTRIDSTDVRGIHETATAEVNAARASRSPRALVIDTYRLCHHSKSDDNRPAEEIAERWRSEPLVVHGERLAESDRQRIDAEVEVALERVIETVRAMP